MNIIEISKICIKGMDPEKPKKILGFINEGLVGVTGKTWVAYRVDPALKGPLRRTGVPVNFNHVSSFSAFGAVFVDGDGEEVETCAVDCSGMTEEEVDAQNLKFFQTTALLSEWILKPAKKVELPPKLKAVLTSGRVFSVTRSKEMAIVGKTPVTFSLGNFFLDGATASCMAVDKAAIKELASKAKDVKFCPECSAVDFFFGDAGDGTATGVLVMFGPMAKPGVKPAVVESTQDEPVPPAIVGEGPAFVAPATPPVKPPKAKVEAVEPVDAEPSDSAAGVPEEEEAPANATLETPAVIPENATETADSGTEGGSVGQDKAPPVTDEDRLALLNQEMEASNTVKMVKDGVALLDKMVRVQARLLARGGSAKLERALKDLEVVRAERDSLKKELSSAKAVIEKVSGLLK